VRPRNRLIKPEAFTDGDLWDLGQSTGLPVFQGFSGLWCWADREGRFEWKPRELKLGILPYWDGEFSDILFALGSAEFIVPYEVDGRRLGYVRTFRKHQSPNFKESASVLPAPTQENIIEIAVACPSLRLLPHA
jgi:hypothetical protein